MHNEDSDRRRELERNALRLLCSELIKAGTRAELCDLLDPGVFHDSLQRVAFEEIRALGAIDSRSLRELLPARVTHRGFPDFDLHEFLVPHQVTEAEIESIFESVLRLIDQSHPDREHFSE